jgi:hypothetical protein
VANWEDYFGAAVRLPTSRFLKIGIDYDFVMHALLALSATHLAWLTDCPLTANMAYEHRGIALKGLHEAIGAFSRQNSDAVLAASLLLSWQATDWSVQPDIVCSNTPLTGI